MPDFKGPQRPCQDVGLYPAYKRKHIYHLLSTEELYKKDLHDPDNHDGVITHLEPDMLECEVKWALGSTTMNKTTGGDGIPAELFKYLSHLKS